MNTITPIVRGDVDPRAVEQLSNCGIGSARHLVMNADGHVGYSQPIGGAVAYADHISPSGVGYDIGCGNKSVRTDILVADLADGDISKIMDEIVERVSFGVGRKNNEKADDPVIDAIREADFTPQRQLVDKAAAQLGTVGAGNHYVDLFEGDDGFLWIGVHFGSRGFGHTTASGFLALSQGLSFESKAREGEMFSPPILFEIDSELGQSYISAMQLAGDYAQAGRNVVVDKVLEILGGPKVTYEVHNHHNYAWRERHGGEDLWVVRKGCTPAFPGQAGFVGSSMGENSVILEGVDSEASAEMLYSTVHGAGRQMGRKEAAGRSRKRWHHKATGWTQDWGEQAPSEEKLKEGGYTKIWVQKDPGLIDWDAARRDLIAKGIERRGGAADEAPLAYKRLDEVLEHHEGTIRVLHQLRPIGVAMAGPDVEDPYKD